MNQKGKENPQLFMFPEDMSKTGDKLRAKIRDRTRKLSKIVKKPLLTKITVLK